MDAMCKKIHAAGDELFRLGDQENKRGSLYEAQAKILDAATGLYAQSVRAREETARILEYASMVGRHELLVSRVKEESQALGACYTQVWDDAEGRSRSCKETTAEGCSGLMRNLKSDYFPDLACADAERMFSTGYKLRDALGKYGSSEGHRNKEVSNLAIQLREDLSSAGSGLPNAQSLGGNKDGSCVSSGTGPVGERTYTCKEGPGALTDCIVPTDPEEGFGGLLRYPFMNCRAALPLAHTKWWPGEEWHEEDWDVSQPTPGTYEARLNKPHRS
jgi:hypothetical protein